MLGEAGSNGADGDAGTVERHHGDLEAQTLSADAVALWNTDVVKAQLAGGRASHAHFVLELADGQTFCILGDDENGDAPCACVGIGLRHDEIVVGNTGVRDPGLAAVEDVRAVVLLCGDGLDARCIRACGGLGQAEGEDLACGCEGEVLLLLLVTAVNEDHVGSQPVCVEIKGDARAALCKLVDNDLRGDGVAAAAAVLLGDVDAHQTGLDKLGVDLLVDLHVEREGFVHCLVIGGDFVLGELPDHVSDHDLLFCEFVHCAFLR